MEGPRGHWLLGNIPAYNADPLAFVANAARDYGDFVALRLGPIRGVLLSNPKDIESVLVEHNRSFIKSRGVRRLRTLLGSGIFTSDGDVWLRHRRLMQPAFHRASVERYGAVMVDRIEAALARWQSRDVLDVVPEMHRLALEIATQTLFGVDITEAESQEIGEAMGVAAAQLQTRVSSLLMFVPDWVPTPGNVRMNSAIRRIDQLVYRVIEERRRSTVVHEDLLALLLAEAGPQAGGLSDRELRDEVVTLLIAGHETTALTLSWALYEIARHAEVADELRTEALAVLGPDRPAGPADVASLPVTLAIVNETLRLYPAGYLTAREAIENVEIGGHKIAKGSLVLISQWEQQREQTHFDDASSFRPSRFYGDLAKSLPRGVFFPFGMGPRMCIGSAFANLEMMLALPMIGRQFRFEPVSADVPKPVPRLTLNPDRPIRLRILH